MSTTIPLYTGSIPSRDDSQTDFDQNIQDFLDYFGGAEATDVIPRINTAAAEVEDNTEDAEQSALEASQHEAGAQAILNQAVSISNATLYLAGSTYDSGDSVIDDLNFLVYKCLVDDTSGVRPSTDTTGTWMLISTVSSGENLFYNSDFALNQEEYDGLSVLSAGEYGHDMLKAITNARWTASEGAGLLVISGTVGQRSPAMVAAHGETVILSIQEGSLAVDGGAAGIPAGGIVVTPGVPYSWTLDMSAGEFLTFGTNLTAAKGISLKRGVSDTSWAKPEPVAERARCERVYRKILSALAFGVSPRGFAVRVNPNTVEMFIPTPGGMETISDITLSSVGMSDMGSTFSTTLTFSSIVAQDHEGVTIRATAGTTIQTGYWRMLPSSYIEINARS